MFCMSLALDEAFFRAIRQCSRTLYLFAKDGCKLIHNGNVIMSGLVHNQRYGLEFVAVNKGDVGNVAHAA